MKTSVAPVASQVRGWDAMGHEVCKPLRLSEVCS